MAHKVGRSFQTTLLIALVAVCLIVARPLSAEPTLSVSVRPSQGTVEDRFAFIVRLKGATSNSTPTLDGGDFEITYIGPQQMVSIVNGVMTREVGYRFHLTPQRAGMLATPSVTLDVEGKTLSHEGVAVAVAPAGTKTKRTNPAKVERTISSATAYIGEQIVLSTTISAKQEVLDLTLEDRVLDGLWQEPIQGFQRGYRRGTPFPHTISRSEAIFPLRTGDILIPARGMGIKIRAQQRTNRTRGSLFDLNPFGNGGMFDQFFRQSFEEFELTAPEHKLTVLPLPSLEPESEVLVGDTILNGRIGANQALVGEPISYLVEVQSFGNLGGLEIELPDTAGIKVYPEQKQLRKEPVGEKLLSTKTFSFTVLGTTPGNVTLPSVSLLAFLPDTREYQKVSSDPIPLRFRPNPNYTPPLADDQSIDIDEHESPQASPQERKGTFYELRWYHHITQRLSLAGVLYMLLAMISIGTGALIAWRFARKPHPRQAQLNLLARASSPAELLALLPSIVTDTNTIGRPPAVMDFVEKSAGADARFRFERCVDQLDRLRSKSTAEDLKIYPQLRDELVGILRQEVFAPHSASRYTRPLPQGVSSGSHQK